MDWDCLWYIRCTLIRLPTADGIRDKGNRAIQSCTTSLRSDGAVYLPYNHRHKVRSLATCHTFIPFKLHEEKVDV